MARLVATGFVLAGGRSSRLGQDKVLLPWNGRTLLEEALDKLRTVCRDVRICTNRLELGKFAPVVPDDAGADASAAVGPLAGITPALAASETDWNLFLAVDLPLLPIEILADMLARAQAGGEFALVPYLENKPQPLCAAYHRSLLPGLQQALADGKYKIMRAVEETTPVARYDVDISRADWFLNVNTIEDLRQAHDKFRNPSGIF